MYYFDQALLTLVPQIRRFARSLATSPADADDLCQMALERALKNKESFQPETRLDAWMYRIVRNCWIDEWRKAARHGARLVHEDWGEGVAGADQHDVEDKMDVSDVGRAMAKLLPEQAEVVGLVLIQELSYKEAAAILDIPIGTLASRLNRGRLALIQLLEPTP